MAQLALFSFLRTSCSPCILRVTHCVSFSLSTHQTMRSIQVRLRGSKRNTAGLLRSQDVQVQQPTTWGSYENFSLLVKEGSHGHGLSQTNKPEYQVLLILTSCGTLYKLYILSELLFCTCIMGIVMGLLYQTR